MPAHRVPSARASQRRPTPQEASVPATRHRSRSPPRQASYGAFGPCLRLAPEGPDNPPDLRPGRGLPEAVDLMGIFDYKNYLIHPSLEGTAGPDQREFY